LFKEGKFTLGAEAAFTLLLMGFVPVFIKFTSANPWTIGVVRLSLAAMLMAVFFGMRDRSVLSNPRNVAALVLIGLLFSLHWITYAFSIKIATASIGILSMSTYGIHLIFLGWIFRKQKPSIFDFIALALATFGTWLIVPEFSMSNNTALGVLLGVFSGFCFAVLPVLHQRNSHIPDRLRILGQFLFALSFYMLFFPNTAWDLKAVDWWALVFLGVMGTFIAHSLWVRVTTRLPTTVSSVIFYINVPLTMFISHFWLGEAMPAVKIFGALFVVGGNLVSFAGRAQKNKGLYTQTNLPKG
jgi:drug/metabolite transporter (DMT)-like permease